MDAVTRRFVTIGRVRKSFGTKGEVLVRLRSRTSFADLVGVTVWFTPPPLEWRSGAITALSVQGDDFRMSVEGLDSIDIAKRLAGCSLVISAEHVSGLWTVDGDADQEILQGYSLVDKRYGDIGVIQETIVTGANDVWVVHGRYGEVLVPVIDEVIGVVDDRARTIEVTLMDGLIESDRL